MPTLQLEFALPANFRLAELLAFHRRDPAGLAERVEPQGVEKGLLWRGRPALLSLDCTDGRAAVRLAIDGNVADDDAASFAQLAHHWLGLNQDVAAFETAYAADALLGPLLAQQSGLRVPQTATPFEALCWAVIGQQISLAAAVSLRRKVILAADVRHSSGLYCFPDAAHLATLDSADLHAAGCSAAKAATLGELARQVAAGSLPLDDWLANPPADEIRQRLLAVKGIGPWTVNYALLRGFGWLDGSLHGDAAVRRRLQALLGQADKVSERQAEAWLAAYSPWRALVAAHLWAMTAFAA